MELSINLEFSESLNEFKYQCITPENEGDFKTVCKDIGYTTAMDFVVLIRDIFPNPLLFVSVVCQWNVYRLKNNL